MSNLNPISFPSLSADILPTILQSLCMNCQANGKTTILPMLIPLFREVLLMSFHCQHCGFHNNQVQFAGKLPDYGVQIHFTVMCPADLNREVVKSEHSIITFQQLELEIQSNGKAEVTTLESVLLRAYEDLIERQTKNQNQKDNPEQYGKMETFVKSLRTYAEGKMFPITVKLFDPSGNSYIKNPNAPKIDKNMHIVNFTRTAQQLQKMGYSPSNAETESKTIQQSIGGNKLNFTKAFEESNFLKHESISFQVPCQSCMMPGYLRICQTDVPYFTDLTIMSFACDYCGAHSAQTKHSGSYGKQGIIITLKVQDDIDLKRDLFKSDTCSVNIPEIELQLDYGTLGGVYTTVQGLIEKIYEHLMRHNPFADSDEQFGDKMQAVLHQLKLMKDGGRNFTLILTDPLAFSFLQNPHLPNDDPNTTREFRKRTSEEDEMLGLDTMKVQNYQQ